MDCTLTLSGPAASFQYDLAAPAPESTTYCVPLAGAPSLNCNRSPGDTADPQQVSITVRPTAVADFEKVLGGSNFAVSLACGNTIVLDKDPQSVGTLCDN